MEEDIKWHNIAVVTVFITCMYFGFKYDNPTAFLGAFIAFWCVR